MNQHERLNENRIRTGRHTAMTFGWLLGLASILSACASGPSPRQTDTTDETTPTQEVTATTNDDTGAVARALPQELAFPQENFRAEQPQAGEPRPFQLPGIHKFNLKTNKVDVYLVERRGLPTVSMGLVFDGGSVNDPPGKEGLASVCMAMLEEGTRQIDKLAFEEKLADIASGVSTYAATDEQGVSMYTLTRHLDETLALWIEMLREPGFRQEDLDRLIARRLEALKQSKGAVASVSTRLRGVVTHGRQHAFGRLPTEASYRAITTADCEKYHATWIQPAGAKLFVVGDIDEKTVHEKFAAKVSKWKGRPPASKSPGRPQGLPGRIFFVPIEGSAQSAVGVYHLGPKRNAPDYFATYLVDRILGGGFSSRINMNLREDKGWAYGARGGFNYDRQASTFFATASVQTEHTIESLLELLDEINAFKTQSRPVGATELDREKQGSILGLPGRFATARETLSMYQELIRHRLPLDYWNRYIPGIQDITATAVARAAGRHLQPQNLVALVVGDPATVMPGLLGVTAEQKLGQGDLVVLDPDGNIKERINKTLAAKRAAELPPQTESPNPHDPTQGVSGSNANAAP